MPKIRDIRCRAFDVPLREAFGIAGGTQFTAQNVLVELELDNDVVGLGEAAPFPAVNGETQAAVLAALPAATAVLRGTEILSYRRVSDAIREVASGTPSARAALEIALFDAWARSASVSLLSFFGGAEARLRTDITIPTGSPEAAQDAARRAAQAGFSTLKVKVGGPTASHDIAHDVARLQGICDAAPHAELVLDANASLDESSTCALFDGLAQLARRVVLLEQPTAAEDVDTLRRLRSRLTVPIAADESARSAADVARLALHRAVDVINIKTMKTGIVEALDMICTARAHGLGLMIGGMVETEISMSTSACLAAGVGGFQFVDLDTPCFMAARPLEGGFRQRGSDLDLSQIELGHGVRHLLGPGADWSEGTERHA
ncbi:MAG TPA: dipeptide epimerase [Polyangiaceae bacterium]|nr:dipeptide epimerase [Polyangiaceae bacterium]